MIIGAIIAMVLLDVGALVVIRRRRAMLISSLRLRRLRRVLWVAGGLLGLAVVALPWRYDAETWILGFPVPGAIFELWTNAKGESFWADFVGPITPLLLAVDLLLCVWLPQSALATILLLRRPQGEPTANKPLQPTGSAGG